MDVKQLSHENCDALPLHANFSLHVTRVRGTHDRGVEEFAAGHAIRE